jgi:hypothetical protein
MKIPKSFADLDHAAIYASRQRDCGHGSEAQPEQAAAAPSKRLSEAGVAAIYARRAADVRNSMLMK